MRTFSWPEYAVLFGYLLAVAVVGGSFYRSKATAQEYFLGGRSMRWLPVGISIIAADLSAITVMGLPGWTFKNNLELMWTFLGPLLAAPLVIGIFIPFYSSLELYTAYEYLERRFNVQVRLVATVLFQLLRIVHVAIAIYAPSLALSLVTGLPVWQCILLMGGITTVYTSAGGVKAVIWTDVIQFTTISLGVALMFVVALRQIDGGLMEAARLAGEAGRLRFWNPSFDPRETTALLPCVIGGTLLTLSTLTTDQALIQRLFATRSQRDASQSILVNAALQIPLLLLLSALGIVLFAFFRQHAPELAGLRSPDEVVPFFAAQQLPPLFSGLVIAAIFSASMAVMSAGINSLSTATTVDIYRRFLRPDADPLHYARFGRGATVVWGLAGTALALFMGRLGELVVAYSKINSLLGGPMLGIFLLGMLSRRATAAGTLAGSFAGAAAVAAVASLTRVSFFYHVAVGVSVTFVAGACASRLMSPPSEAQIDGLVLEHFWSGSRVRAAASPEAAEENTTR